MKKQACVRLSLPLFLPLSLGLMFLAGGCGGESAPALTEEAFCEEKAHRECKGVMNACSYGDSDVTACEGTRVTACQSLAASQKTEVRNYKASNTGACLKQVSSIYGPSIGAQAWKKMEEECKRVYEGDGQENGPCEVDYDCVKPLICDLNLCAKKTTVSAGANCNNPGQTCPTGQYCALGSSNIRVCQPRADVDQSCSATVPCKETLRCVAGTCEQRLPLQSACTSHGDCASDLCDPLASVCVNAVTFAFGERCNNFAGLTSGN